jgi:hypothetical protein
MKPSEWITEGMAMVASYPLDAQWRFAVAALSLFCMAGLLALLPELPELQFIWRAARAIVPIIKVRRLLAGRRQDWRGLLLDVLN